MKSLFATLIIAFLFIGCSSSTVNVNTIPQLEKAEFLNSSDVKNLLLDKEIKFTKSDGKVLYLNHKSDGTLTGLPVKAKWEIYDNGVKNIIVNEKVVSSVKIKKVGDKYFAIDGNEIKSTF